MQSKSGQKPEDTTQLDAQIAELVEYIRSQQAAIEAAETSIREVKEELLELLEARGGNWSDDVGYARLLSEGKRNFYDTEALDNLLLKDPLHYGWLKDYRRESSVPSRVAVR